MTRGWWNMACWNGLSEQQQLALIEDGTLEWGSVPLGADCQNGAEVAIETQEDAAPGPRFYCRPCAIAYLGTRSTLTDRLLTVEVPLSAQVVALLDRDALIRDAKRAMTNVVLDGLRRTRDTSA